MLEDEHLIDEFEKDIWLYLDNDLPTERMNFWETQIQNNAKIGQKFNEIQRFLSDYDNYPSEKLESNKFNTMILKATKKEHLFLKIKSIFHFDNKSESLLPKMAFVTSLTIAAIVMLLLSQKPNPIKEISTELFDWDDESTTMQIQSISNTIFLVDNENLKNYIIYKLSQDEWNRDIYNIKNQIQNLDKETNKTAF
ncbi:MAG: hypothetical protein GXO85_12555 [Chlorobi bacterium]|nr:hypothetical protein [Chlorobiota bacterium]